jgi:hypothetical protein
MITDKEKKAVGGLVEPTVAESMSWHGASIDVVGFGATEAALVVSATVKVPIGLKQRAGRGGFETPRHIRPGDTAVLSNVASGDLVRDALITERVQKPVENLGRVTINDGIEDASFLYIASEVIKKRQRARQATDPSDQINHAIIWLGNNVGGRSQTCGGFSRQLPGWGRFQIRDTNLRWASLSPSM